MNIKRQLKQVRYLIEALIVKLGLLFFHSLTPKIAANFAAKIATFIGPKIAVHKLAYKNITNALPELNENRKKEILADMWDNLGRIIGEYPHIAYYKVEEIEEIVEFPEETIKNIEFIKNSKKGGIIFSGHIGNWEVGPKAFMKFGIIPHTVYRSLNNPYVEKMTATIRNQKMITKGTSGNRMIIDVIKNGGFIIIMADQKISEGEPVQFFHDKAITTTSIAKIALKYDVSLIPARSIRIGKDFKFIIDVEKPLEFDKTEDINKNVINLTLKINQKLESWIKEYPSQWFWVHNRWKK
jgi:KDO2-lipid IV(A) lauroyltransferase